MRFFTRSIFGLALLGVTLVLLAGAIYSLRSASVERAERNNKERPARERSFTVNVMNLKMGEVSPVITAFGEVVSGKTLELRAASNGALVELSPKFREGGRVEKGELLFQSDPASQIANVELAQTELTEAQAELIEARDQLILSQDELRASERQLELRNQAYERQKTLRASGIGTEASLEAAALSASSSETSVLSKRQALANTKARIKRGETGLKRREINLKEAKRKLTDLTVVAGFDGVLTNVTAVLGGLVSTNQKLGELIDPNALEVSFRVSNAQYASLLAQGNGVEEAEVSLRLNGNTKEIEATITRIGAAVTEGQTGREVFASLNGDAGNAIQPGDFVTVSVTEPALKDVVIIPATAANAAGEVFIVNEDQRLERAKVEILRKQGSDLVVRAQSLDGRDLVKERAPQLGVGIKVEPRYPIDKTALEKPDATEQNQTQQGG